MRVGIGDGRRDRGWRWSAVIGDVLVGGLLGLGGISTPPCRTCDARSVSSDARSAWTDLPDVARCPDFDAAAALSPLAAATCDGPAKHTKSPAATIKAERPLALTFIGNLPICPPPKRKETPRRVRSGAKKGNLRARPGESRAVRLRWPTLRAFFARDSAEDRCGGCQCERDRCYEPAGRGIGYRRFPDAGPRDGCARELRSRLRDQCVPIVTN